MPDKPQGKVEIKIGNMSFSAEGDQAWLSEQLAKVIEAAAVVPAAKGGGGDGGGGGGSGSGEAAAAVDGENEIEELFKGSLASCLKATGGESKQVQRFLATAGWLFKRSQTQLTPTVVAKALTDHHQKKLANPADCLNQNCAKGYCEKTKDGFYITPEGWAALTKSK